MIVAWHRRAKILFSFLRSVDRRFSLSPRLCILLFCSLLLLPSLSSFPPPRYQGCALSAEFPNGVSRKHASFRCTGCPASFPRCTREFRLIFPRCHCAVVDATPLIILRLYSLNCVSGLTACADTRRYFLSRPSRSTFDIFLISSIIICCIVCCISIHLALVWTTSFGPRPSRNP